MNLTPEQKARMASGNTSDKGRKGRKASPWDRGPMCDTTKAKRSRKDYLRAEGNRHG